MTEPQTPEQAPAPQPDAPVGAGRAMPSPGDGYDTGPRPDSEKSGEGAESTEEQ